MPPFELALTGVGTVVGALVLLGTLLLVVGSLLPVAARRLHVIGPRAPS